MITRVANALWVTSLLLISSAGTAVEQISSAGIASLKQVEQTLNKAQVAEQGATELFDTAHLQISAALELTASDPALQARWLHLLWLHSFLREDYEASINALNTALEQLAAANERSEETVDALNNLSTSLILTGKVSQAINYLRQALVLALELNESSRVAEIYYNLGDAYLKAGDHDVARRYFEKDYEYQAAHGSEWRLMVANIKLGTIARLRGDLDTAITLHKKALQFYTSTGAYRRVVAHIELARDYLTAEDYVQAAHNAIAAIGNPITMTEQSLDARIALLSALDHLTTAERAVLGEQYTARAVIESIEALLENFGHYADTIPVRPIRHVNYASVAIRHYASSGERSEVHRIGQAISALIFKMGWQLASSANEYLSWRARAQAVVKEYVRAIYQHEPAMAFVALETIYCHDAALRNINPLSFLDLSSEASTISEFESLLNARTNLVDARAIALQNGAANTSLRELEGALDIAKERYLNDLGAQFDILASEPPGTVEARCAMAPKLRNGEVYLRYFIDEDLSFVALRDDQGGTAIIELPKRSRVTKMLATLHDDVKSAQLSSTRALAQLSRLNALVPHEVLQRGNDITRLIIAPDSTVQGVPFSAINLNADPATYLPLNERYELIRVRSLNEYYSEQPHRAQREMTDNDLTVFADPVFQSYKQFNADENSAASQWVQSLARLPYTRKEAEAIALNFTQQEVRLLIGTDATAQALLAEAGHGAKLLHIATHGYFNALAPDIVGIAVSPEQKGGRNGFLGLDELLAREFHSRLVILSGCDTMRGRRYEGGAVSSISHAFLARGVGAVIGTIWPVSDRASAAFMARFYTAMRDSGGNASRALKLAREQLRQSRRFAHPRYWAGYILNSSHWRIDTDVFQAATTP